MATPSFAGTCDCRICRYHERPFPAGSCPHPKFGHRDQTKWGEYLASAVGRRNIAAHVNNREIGEGE